LATLVKENCDIEKVVDTLQEATTTTCNNSFRNAETIYKYTKYKSVPWWTLKYTKKRIRPNALRRLYQRTLNSEQR